MNINHVRWLFAICGLYDLLIGLVFLLFGPTLFEAAEVPQPNHWAYIQFGALMLIIFGVMFVAVAVNPHRNRNLIPFGILLKVSYIGLVSYYWVQTGVPFLFQPFVFIDGIMLVLFVIAFISIGPSQNAAL